MNRPNHSFVYSAAEIADVLRMPIHSTAPVPEPEQEGEIVVYYDGWTLRTLRESTAGRWGMDQVNPWYDFLQDHDLPAESGYYRVMLQVPGSNGKTGDEQFAHLAAFDGGRWRPAPVQVATTALLAHLYLTGQDALAGKWARCAHGSRWSQLSVRDARVAVSPSWAVEAWNTLWLAAARRVPDPPPV